MIAADEDALVCDFAETYHIYDFRALPLQYAATLAFGLRDNSRIKTKLSGMDVPFETLAAARIVDCLNLLLWQNTQDGFNGVNMPQSILKKMLDGTESGIDGDLELYDSVEAFEAARNNLLTEAG